MEATGLLTSVADTLVVAPSLATVALAAFSHADFMAAFAPAAFAPAAFALAALFGRWPRRTVTVRDEPEVAVVAVLRSVACAVESSGPDASSGPEPEAIPPVWFERGAVTAVLGAADLALHRWSAEPAVVTVRALFGDVTVAVPDDWAARLDVRSIAGRVADGRPGPAAVGDGPVHLVVTGLVAFGRVRVVGRDGR